MERGEILGGKTIQVETIREVLLPSGDLVNGLVSLQMTWGPDEVEPDLEEVPILVF